MNSQWLSLKASFGLHIVYVLFRILAYTGCQLSMFRSAEFWYLPTSGDRFVGVAPLVSVTARSSAIGLKGSCDWNNDFMTALRRRKGHKLPVLTI